MSMDISSDRSSGNIDSMQVESRSSELFRRIIVEIGMNSAFVDLI